MNFLLKVKGTNKWALLSHDHIHISSLFFKDSLPLGVGGLGYGGGSKLDVNLILWETENL